MWTRPAADRQEDPPPADAIDSRLHASATQELPHRWPTSAPPASRVPILPTGIRQTELRGIGLRQAGVRQTSIRSTGIRRWKLASATEFPKTPQHRKSAAALAVRRGPPRSPARPETSRNSCAAAFPKAAMSLQNHHAPANDRSIPERRTTRTVNSYRHRRPGNRHRFQAARVRQYPRREGDS